MNRPQKNYLYFNFIKIQKQKKSCSVTLEFVVERNIKIFEKTMKFLEKIPFSRKNLSRSPI